MGRKNYQDASDIADSTPRSAVSDDDALLARLPLTSALEALPDAVGVYDREGRLIFSNTVAQRLFGSGASSAFMARSIHQRVSLLTPRDTEGKPLSPERLHITRLLAGETITSDQPVEMRITSPSGEERIISVTGAPITAENGEILGAIAIARDITEQRTREREQAEVMRRELDTSKSSEQAAQELERLQTALDTALMRLSLDDLLDALLESASASLKTDTATLLLLDKEGKSLKVRAARGLEKETIAQVNVPVGKGFAGRIAATGEPLYLPDTKHVEVVSAYLREQLHSVVGAPLIVENRVIGVLHVGSTTPRVFTKSNIWLLQQIAERAALAIDHAQLYEALQQAHREATAQAKKLDAIIDALTEGVILYGPDRSTLHANSAYRHMFDITPESDQLDRDFVARGHAVAPRDTHGNLLPEEQWPATRVLRGEVIDSEHSQDIWLRSYDGRDALYSATGGPVYDDQGGFIGAVMALRDVTAHRQLEREATARAAELEAIIETMVDGLFVHDTDGRLIRVNSRGREHFGLNDDADASQRGTLHDNLGKVLPEEQWPVARVLRGEALTGTQAMELTVRMPNGHERLLNVSGAPMRNAKGQILGAVMLSRDVTGLHALERRTQESLEALLEMAEAVVSATALASDGDSVKQVGKRLIELARRVLGCQRMAISVLDQEAGIMRALAVTGLTPSEERQWWEEQDAAERQGARLENAPDQELVQQLRAGTPVAIDLRDPRYRDIPNHYNVQTMLVSPMLIAQQLVGIISLDYAGQPHEFTSEELNLASAVSKLAALVIERDHMLREQAIAEAQVIALAQANQRMDEFLGIAAHELRTPITVIKANLQMLLRRSLQVAEQANTGKRVVVEPQRASRDAELLSRTERALTRLTRLVDDLLDVSRVRAGKLEMRIEQIELADVVRDTVEEQRLATPDRRIELKLPQHQPTPTLADAARVGQVITNYLTNALKYSNATTPVRVRLWREGVMACVSVTDEGPGIPRAELDHVWELFHRIPGIEVVSGSGIGLGLGLHLCKTIIERQGGEVGVTSRLGKGSTFWFSLPMLHDPETP